MKDLATYVATVQGVFRGLQISRKGQKPYFVEIIFEVTLPCHNELLRICYNFSETIFV